MLSQSTRFILFAGVSVLLSACAHYPDVRAGVDGIHRVVISTDDNEANSKCNSPSH